jgi:hypothetical protein
VGILIYTCDMCKLQFEVVNFCVIKHQDADAKLTGEENRMLICAKCTRKILGFINAGGSW